MNHSQEFAKDELEPEDLAKLQSSGKSVVLLDVREPEEHEYVRLEDSWLIPLMELEQNLEQIKRRVEKADVLVVYCRSGHRSGSAVEFLKEQGIACAINLRGGINAYSTKVDSTLPQY